MKEIVFYAAFAFLVPIGVLGSVGSRFAREAVFVALVVSTCAPFVADINLEGREWYRGTTRGIEISYLDVLSIILLVSTALTRRQDAWRYPAASGVLPNGQPLDTRAAFWPFGLLPMVLYFAWAVVTVFLMYPHIFGVFELSKMVRALVIFVAVAWFVRGPREVRLLVYGLVLAALYVTAWALYQRYVMGSHRVYLPFAHPNILSMYSCAVAPVVLAAALSNASYRLRWLLLLVAPMMVGCVLMAISRTGYATVVLTTGLTLAAVVGLQFNTRNLLIVVGALVVGSGMLYKSWDSVIGRLGATSLEDEYLEEGHGRGVYLRLARQIIVEHPFGIGLNNWSWHVSGTVGESVDGTVQVPYHSTDESPDIDERALRSQAPPAHNLAALTLGELGWPGLILMSAIWGAWGWATLGYLVERAPDISSRVAVGIFFGLLAVFIHNFTEWAFRDTPIYLLAHIYAGAASAMYRQRKLFAQGPRFVVRPRDARVDGETETA